MTRMNENSNELWFEQLAEDIFVFTLWCNYYAITLPKNSKFHVCVVSLRGTLLDTIFGIISWEIPTINVSMQWCV